MLLSGAAALPGSFLAALTPPLAQLPDSFWLPAPASTTSGTVDTVFYVVYWISVFFFALIVGLMTWFAVRYRRRKVDEVPDATPSHNLALEITWTAIPVVITAAIFVLGFKSFMHMVVPPRDAYEIQVTGQKWQWFFTYPNGFVTSELNVPVGRPVRLVMTSEDVIHSLFIPAFRVKQDVVPGRYSQVWFEATAAGSYPLLCTEYCGTGHSDMLTTVTVHEPGMFEVWLEKEANFLDSLPPAEAGELLVQRTGCLQCHSLDGRAMIGPSFQNLYGHVFPTTTGERVTADENYIRESILEPMASVVAGYEPVMPTYAGKIKDKEITAIIAYLKTLSDKGASGSEASADSTQADDSAGEDE